MWLLPHQAKIIVFLKRNFDVIINAMIDQNESNKNSEIISPTNQAISGDVAANTKKVAPVTGNSFFSAKVNKPKTLAKNLTLTVIIMLFVMALAVFLIFLPFIISLIRWLQQGA